jgi:MFS-type transporter involved in bile tolerance (Atg22 family)
MRRKYPMTLRYLIAYLVYNDGIQRVIVVATSFAFLELGVGNETLLLLVPPAPEVEFFSFYEISERGTSWIGPLAFGAAVMITGSQRVAIVSLILFFVAGLLLLSRVDVGRAIAEAGRDSGEMSVETVVHDISPLK